MTTSREGVPRSQGGVSYRRYPGSLLSPVLEKQASTPLLSSRTCTKDSPRVEGGGGDESETRLLGRCVMRRTLRLVSKLGLCGVGDTSRVPKRGLSIFRGGSLQESHFKVIASIL